MPIPVLVQHVMSTINDNNGIAGDAYQYTLPNAVLAGNCLQVFISYPAGSSPTISDTNGSWTGAQTASVSGTNLATKIFILPNAAGGIHTITATFGASVRPVQMSISEWNNIALTSPLDGSIGVGSTTTSPYSAGSFTPTTNNDANGGHLILTYAMANDNVGDGGTNALYASAMTPTSSQTLVDADNATSIPHCIASFVQTANGAINPGFTITQGSATSGGFNVLAVALLVANAGAAPGNQVRVVRLLHVDAYIQLEHNTGGFPVLFPSSGNTLVFTTASNTSFGLTYAGVSDPTNGAYTEVPTGGGANAQCFYKTNATPSPSLKLTVNNSTSPGVQTSIRLFDIANGGAFDTFTGAVPSPSGGATWTGAPPFTPGVAPGITLVSIGLGTGPFTGLASGAPAGAVFDSIQFTGNNDSDQMDNADGVAHVRHTTTAAQSWNWSLAPAAQGQTAFGIAFSFAEAVAGPPPSTVLNPQTQQHMLTI